MIFACCGYIVEKTLIENTGIKLEYEDWVGVYTVKISLDDMKQYKTPLKDIFHYLMNAGTLEIYRTECKFTLAGITKKFSAFVVLKPKKIFNILNPKVAAKPIRIPFTLNTLGERTSVRLEISKEYAYLRTSVTFFTDVNFLEKDHDSVSIMTSIKIGVDTKHLYTLVQNKYRGQLQCVPSETRNLIIDNGMNMWYEWHTDLIYPPDYIEDTFDEFYSGRCYIDVYVDAMI